MIPFDVLERESPETFRRVVRGGATRFVVVGDKQIAVAEDAGTTHVVPVDIERLAHTPMLDAGDLLLMRGDVIHRTQDTDTERVSLSLRVASTKTVISRTTLADGPLAKARTMVNNPPMYEPIFRAFEDTGKNEMEIGELITWWTAKASSLKPSDPKGFYRYPPDAEGADGRRVLLVEENHVEHRRRPSLPTLSSPGQSLTTQQDACRAPNGPASHRIMKSVTESAAES